SQNIYIFSLLLLTGYLIFTARQVLTLLTVHLPFGQLFRTWEIGQYIVNFFIVTAFVGVFINTKARSYVKPISIFLISLYIVASIVDFNLQLVFVKKTDVDQYRNINTFLDKDDANFKVLWVPEMSWYGVKTQPTWLNDQSASAQDFIEFASSKPTYL